MNSSTLFLLLSIPLPASILSFSSSSSFSIQRGDCCRLGIFSMQNQDWRKSSSCTTRVSNLSALPKRELKQHKPFQVNASSFGFPSSSSGKGSQQGGSGGVEVKDDEEALLLEQYDLDIMLQQKQEFEAYLQNRGFVQDKRESNQILSSGGSSDGMKTEQTSRISDIWQARLLLLASAALYGTNFTFVKVLNENVPVQLGTAMRFVLAALATLPWLFGQTTMSVQEGSVSKAGEMDNGSANNNSGKNSASSFTNRFGVILGGMEVGTWNAIGYLAQAIGLETTHASTSAFICSLAVVIVPILDYLAGKKLLRREMIGAILAVAGVALLEFDGVEQSINVGNSGMLLCPGDLYSLVQPLAFGMGFWRMEHYMRKFPNAAMKLTAAQLSMISMLSLVALVFSSGIEMDFRNISFVVDWLQDPVVAGSLFWTGLVTTALTVAMETMALKTLSAAETTMLFSTEPIFGGLCASFVLGEQFGVGGMIGSAMVLGGCLYSNLDLGGGEKKKK